ncbi:MAG: purine-nucleoside phosphorylase [Coriobacteriales bacterium]|nr:purine-nucleoside phosphorylase [Actinomycetes bacterium]
MPAVSLEVPVADVRRVRDLAGEPPRVAAVLGSGLSGVAACVEDPAIVPYSGLQGFPATGPVAGHAGELRIGRLAGVEVVLFAGRAHQYQGVSALDAAYPARLAAAVGCEVLIVTNAAGAVSHELAAGDIVLISDHINLMGTNPLIGWPGPAGGVPFVPMRDAYDPELIALARAVAAERGVALQEGVYAGLLGPSYETAAEVRYLERIGADVVGMSTVPEVIAARALGLRVLGFSLVTNVAAGAGLSHEEVLEAGRAAGETLGALMLGILQRL